MAQAPKLVLPLVTRPSHLLFLTIIAFSLLRSDPKASANDIGVSSGVRVGDSPSEREHTTRLFMMLAVCRRFQLLGTWKARTGLRYRVLVRIPCLLARMILCVVLVVLLWLLLTCGDVEANPGPEYRSMALPHSAPLPHPHLHSHSNPDTRQEESLRDRMFSLAGYSSRDHASPPINPAVVDPATSLEGTVQTLVYWCDFFQQENAFLKKNIGALAERCDTIEKQSIDLYQWRDAFVEICDKVDVDLDKLESFSRRNNIRLFNVMEDSSEGSATCIRKVVQLLNRFFPAKTWSTDDVDRAHRLGVQNNSQQPRPIIACLHRWQDKLLVLQNRQGRTEMAETTYIRVASDLTDRQNQRLREEKEAGRKAFFWKGQLRYSTQAQRKSPRRQTPHRPAWNNRQTGHPTTHTDRHTESTACSGSRQDIVPGRPLSPRPSEELHHHRASPPPMPVDMLAFPNLKRPSAVAADPRNPADYSMPAPACQSSGRSSPDFSTHESPHPPIQNNPKGQPLSSLSLSCQHEANLQLPDNQIDLMTTSTLEMVHQSAVPSSSDMGCQTDPLKDTEDPHRDKDTSSEQVRHQSADYQVVVGRFGVKIVTAAVSDCRNDSKQPDNDDKLTPDCELENKVESPVPPASSSLLRNSLPAGPHSAEDPSLFLDDRWQASPGPGRGPQSPATNPLTGSPAAADMTHTDSLTADSPQETNQPDPSQLDDSQTLVKQLTDPWSEQEDVERLSPVCRDRHSRVHAGVSGENSPSSLNFENEISQSGNRGPQTRSKTNSIRQTRLTDMFKPKETTENVPLLRSEQTDG